MFNARALEFLKDHRIAFKANPEEEDERLRFTRSCSVTVFRRHFVKPSASVFLEDASNTPLMRRLQRNGAKLVFHVEDATTVLAKDKASGYAFNKKLNADEFNCHVFVLSEIEDALFQIECAIRRRNERSTVGRGAVDNQKVVVDISEHPSFHYKTLRDSGRCKRSCDVSITQVSDRENGSGEFKYHRRESRAKAKALYRKRKRSSSADLSTANSNTEMADVSTAAVASVSMEKTTTDGIVDGIVEDSDEESILSCGLCASKLKCGCIEEHLFKSRRHQKALNRQDFAYFKKFLKLVDEDYARWKAGIVAKALSASDCFSNNGTDEESDDGKSEYESIDACEIDCDTDSHSTERVLSDLSLSGDLIDGRQLHASLTPVSKMRRSKCFADKKERERLASGKLPRRSKRLRTKR